MSKSAHAPKAVTAAAGGEAAAASARRLLLVAHGQPSDPLPAAQELEALAQKVAAELPGWQVVAATLAEPGALARLDPAPGFVFPVFMAAGWFTGTALPARLDAAGLRGWQMLAPLGCALALEALAVRIIRASGAAEVLVAAHGSGRSAAPALRAQEVAKRILAESGAARVEVAFIEQEPWLTAVQGWGAEAVCLPFFAMAGQHVSTDLPEALAEAGFPGRILPALGLHPEVPGLIAQLVLAAAAGGALAPV